MDQEKKREPLPTLYIAEHGYKCLNPYCVHAMHRAQPGVLECKAGHLFAEGGTYRSVEELPTQLEG